MYNKLMTCIFYLIAVISHYEQYWRISKGQHVTVHGPETDPVSERRVDQVHVVTDGLRWEVDY